MTDRIFLVREEDELVELRSESYDSEDLLQELLARFPSLIAQGEDAGSYSRLLLIEREAGIPGESEGSSRWALDHLFVDDQAVPTLVEVKRSTDTRIRREVVGQMLDYAANAVAYWPIERIRAAYEQTCKDVGADPELHLRVFLNGGDTEAFWLRVKTNLQAGRIRMLFVADEIPSELRRVVEFLNGQMDPAEVAAVEIRQFVGQGFRTLVPSMLGQTAGSERKKAAGRSDRRQWDEGSFFAELGEKQPDAVEVARRLHAWASRAMPRPWWGQGAQLGSFIPVLDHQGEGHTLIALWTNGTVAIQIGYMERRAPFSSEQLRRELLGRLNQIEGVSIPPEAVSGRFPSIPMSTFGSGRALQAFIEVLEWAVQQIKSSGVDDGGA